MATTSAPGPTMELLGRVAYEFQVMRPLLPTYLHLIISAVFPIFTAAHASLARPSSAAPIKKTKSSSDTEDEDGEPSPQIETLSPSDAIVFPVLAGCTLAGLYFALKALEDPAWLNYLLGLYFGGVGFFFATRFIKDALSVLRSLALPLQYTSGGRLWKVSRDDQHFRSPTSNNHASPLPGIFRFVPLPKFVRTRLWALRRVIYNKAQMEIRVHNIMHFKSSVSILDFFSIMLSLVIVWYHTFIDKPWFLTNSLGFSFCYGSLQFMTPGTSWTGTLLLCALFFYDIYFVFFTPMMVTVATKLDVPIKLLFPRPVGCIMPVGAADGSAQMEEYLRCLAKKRTMAMLGLGDIVIPGMMLAFALRFDLYLFYLRMKPDHSATQDKNTESQKPIYSSATGLWGERIWTNRSFQSRTLRFKQFPKTYFYATTIGYILGMIVTVVVMQVFQHAQPALLFLGPGVMVSFWGTALVRGELKILWNFSEVPEDEKPKDENVGPKGSSEKSKVSKIDGVNESSEQEEQSTSKDSSSHPSSQNSVLQDTNESTTKDSTAQISASAITKPDKNLKTKAESKSGSSSRHLIYFAITLPESNTTRSSGSGARENKDDKDKIKNSRPPSNHTLSSSSSEDSSSGKSTDKTVKVDYEETGKRHENVTSHTTTTVGRVDQPPPEKRRRKV